MIGINFLFYTTKSELEKKYSENYAFFKNKPRYHSLKLIDLHQFSSQFCVIMLSETYETSFISMLFYFFIVDPLSLFGNLSPGSNDSRLSISFCMVWYFKIIFLWWPLICYDDLLIWSIFSIFLNTFVLLLTASLLESYSLYLLTALK